MSLGNSVKNSMSGTTESPMKAFNSWKLMQALGHAFLHAMQKPEIIWESSCRKD